MGVVVGGLWRMVGGRVKVNGRMDVECKCRYIFSELLAWNKEDTRTAHHTNELAQAAQLCSISIWLTTTGISHGWAEVGLFGRGEGI